MEHPENNEAYKGLVVNAGIEQPSSVNPYLKNRPRRKKRELSVSDYVEGIVKGDVTVLSQAVTLVESVKPEQEVEKTEEKDDNLFRLNSVKLESKIKVTGKIDLDALNQSTRPKKKTKEEKRKERDEKQKFNNNRPGNNSNGPGAPHKSPNSPTLIKPNAPTKPGEEGDAKKKRKRIKKDRVDVNNTPGTNYPRPNRDDRPNNDRKPRLKKPVKAEVSEEDVQKQIKETLARLTNKNNKNNKGAKYRRDKRDAAVKREHELMEQEELESKVLKLTEFVTANDLANMMDVSVTEVLA